MLTDPRLTKNADQLSALQHDAAMVENMIMFYDEVCEQLTGLGIMSADEIARQQELLHTVRAESLPSAWATFRVACERVDREKGNANGEVNTPYPAARWLSRPRNCDSSLFQSAGSGQRRK